MDYKKASEILTQAINYDEEGRVGKDNWILGTEDIEVIKIAIEALKKSKEISISDAMNIIKNALKEDKTEGSYYYSWQSNIACSIMDNSNLEHDKANEISIKFLESLIR